MVCRCDNNACSTCVCAKSNTLCTLECHGKKDWSLIPCLNTEAGKKVKAMKIKDVRTALCANNLSPIGDRGELLKRLADFFHQKEQSASATATTSGNNNKSVDKTKDNKDLFNAILENEGEFEFVLSLSGKSVSKSSSKPDLRKAYLLLSTKVHPDKNPGIKEAVQAFQVVLSSYERLANPEKFEEDDDADVEPTGKRRKMERFTRSNAGCFKTKIKCPQCNQTWGGADLGLEDAAYNFFMMAIKQYICGRCSCEFGCMTAHHYCPRCNKEMDYDPDDYHRKITCGNKNCNKEFGFWMFKVSERREKEVRAEAKQRQEDFMKRIAQKNRRTARAGKRVVKGDKNTEQRLQEQLFIIRLRDTCPRCGWALPREEGSEEAKQHLEECNDSEKIKTYQAFLEKEKQKSVKKEVQKETQAEIMALKQWEHNGRQVGQLWMLSEKMLKKHCTEFGLETGGLKHEIISRLGKYLRSHEKLMITDGSSKVAVSYDTCGITHADEEDLPQNIHRMEREELQELCASYGIKFNAKDVKTDLIKKFESARMKDKAPLMICDKKKKDDESDEEYIP